LSSKVLEEIRLISGIETHKEKVLRIILSGQPELRDTLDSPRLKQLMQRVRLRFHLGSLDKREMREYIEHRLEVAGREESDLFAAETFDIIHRFTGGVPRLINTLCDSALLCAFADEKEVVDEADIRAAIDELNWHEHENTTGRHKQLQQLHEQRSGGDEVTAIQIYADGDLVAEHAFPLGRVIVGRSKDNEVFIDSKFVSRHHAQLVSDERGCVVEDLNSTNGVFLREKQVKKYRLRDGDRLSIGVHELVYRDLRLQQHEAADPNDNKEEELGDEEQEEQESDSAAVNEE
ncbi:MAG: FHA domain-containing protein, partial [Gammaproteobacteria bacterium]|nr:FHA domain-containing protein [Gammaproteobacteria bacterium]